MEIKNLLPEVINRIKNIPPNKRYAFIAGIAAFSLLLAFFIKVLRYESYETLYAGLAPEQSHEIIQRLKERRIPYVLESGAIKVPGANVGELRIEMAAEGLIHGRHTGFELFDRFNLGITDFEQRVNYQRALQGELGRTINYLNEVRGCRVHVVLAERNIFGQQRKPSASVLIDLKPGYSLNRTQVQGIANLVAGSIPEIDINDVSVMDTRGNTLFKQGDKFAELGENIGHRITFQKKVEEHLAEKARELLTASLGWGKVIVQVGVDIDFTKMDREEEVYTPVLEDEGIIRSREVRTERTKGELENTGGTVGTHSNTPFYSILREGTEAEHPSAPPVISKRREPASTDSEHTITNYEVNRRINRVVETPGNIRRISAAVLVDGRYEKSPGDDDILEYIPRSDGEMLQIENITVAALGIQRERGDTVSIENIAFDRSYMEQEKALMEEARKREIRASAISRGIGVVPWLMGMAALAFAFKMLTKISPGTEKTTEKTAEMPAGEVIKQVAQEKPEVIAGLVKDWLSEK